MNRVVTLPAWWLILVFSHGFPGPVPVITFPFNSFKSETWGPKNPLWGIPICSIVVGVFFSRNSTNDPCRVGLGRCSGSVKERLYA